MADAVGVAVVAGLFGPLHCAVVFVGVFLDGRLRLVAVGPAGGLCLICYFEKCTYLEGRTESK